MHILEIAHLALYKITGRWRPNEYSVAVVNKSKEHNRAAALTCLKKNIEKAEEINVAKYDKIIVWRDGCSAQVCSRFVFPPLNGEFFDGNELMWNCNEKSHEKGHMAGVGGTVKTSSFTKSIRTLLRLIHLSSFIKPY